MIGLLRACMDEGMTEKHIKEFSKKLKGEKEMKKLFEERLTGKIGRGYKGKYTIRVHEFNPQREEKEYEIICNTKDEVIKELTNVNPGQYTNINVVLNNEKNITVWYGQGDTGKAVAI